MESFLKVSNHEQVDTVKKKVEVSLKEKDIIDSWYNEDWWI